MNKINELKNQALSYSTVDPASGFCDIDIAFEKFAELIIQECAAICLDSAELYFIQRKGTDDFTDKQIYSSAESALQEAAKNIIKTFENKTT